MKKRHIWAIEKFRVNKKQKGAGKKKKKKAKKSKKLPAYKANIKKFVCGKLKAVKLQ